MTGPVTECLLDSFTDVSHRRHEISGGEEEGEPQFTLVGNTFEFGVRRSSFLSDLSQPVSIPLREQMSSVQTALEDCFEDLLF